MLDHSRTFSAVALDLLRVGAPVSIGFHALGHDPILAELHVKQHTLACLDEVSVLSPSPMSGIALALA